MTVGSGGRAPSRDSSAQRRAIDEPSVPIASVASGPRLLLDAGVDPAGVAVAAGLDPGWFGDPAVTISFVQMGHYLQACVYATRDETFAVRLKACGGDVEQKAKLVQEIVERVYVRGERVVGMTLKPIFHLVLNHRLRGTMYPVGRKNDVPGDAHKP